MSFTFPKQVRANEFVAGRVEKILQKNALLMDADGALVVIPFSSIKYRRMYAAPQKLPNYVIKDATVEA
jgi:hypothetical protein